MTTAVSGDVTSQPTNEAPLRNVIPVCSSNCRRRHHWSSVCGKSRECGADPDRITSHFNTVTPPQLRFCTSSSQQTAASSQHHSLLGRMTLFVLILTSLELQDSSQQAAGGDVNRAAGFPRSGDGTRAVGFPRRGDGTRAAGFPRSGDGTRAAGFPRSGDVTRAAGFPRSGDGTRAAGFPRSGDVTRAAGFPRSGDVTRAAGFPRNMRRLAGTAGLGSWRPAGPVPSEGSSGHEPESPAGRTGERVSLVNTLTVTFFIKHCRL